METSVKDRVKEYCKHKKMPVSEFEKRCGLANGYVNGISNSIGEQKLKTISLTFPDLNIAWLMTGMGEMLNVNTEKNECACVSADDCEVYQLSKQMKIAPLVPVDITYQQNVRIWEYVQRHKDMYDHIPSQLLPNFDLIHIVKGNALQPAIEKGDVLFLQHLELTIDSIVNGHVYFIDTKKNGIVVKKVFINEGQLQCFSLSGKIAVKTFSLDDIYDIFSVVTIMKFSIYSNDYFNEKERMLDKMVDANREVIGQNRSLIDELSAQRRIIEKLIDK